MGTRHLKRITDECNITEKVVAAVTDNAANIAAAVRLNGWRHVPWMLKGNLIQC